MKDTHLVDGAGGLQGCIFDAAITGQVDHLEKLSVIRRQTQQGDAHLVIDRHLRSGLDASRCSATATT